MNSVFIALGSNLGNRLEYCQQAVNLLSEMGNIIKIAPIYEAAAYGYHEQGAFLNSALIFETDDSPLALLQKLKDIERQTGRKSRFHWGPREIDLDIIFFDHLILNSQELTIPHPDFHNRQFVLQPLKDLEPGFLPPGFQQTVAELLEHLTDKSKLKLIKKEWYPDGN